MSFLDGEFQIFYFLIIWKVTEMKNNGFSLLADIFQCSFFSKRIQFQHSAIFVLYTIAAFLLQSALPSTLGLESVDTPTFLSKRERLCFVFVLVWIMRRGVSKFQERKKSHLILISITFLLFYTCAWKSWHPPAHYPDENKNKTKLFPFW